jgi:hypothetical protein
MFFINYFYKQYNEETQKMFILLEFTRKRKFCDAIIDILRELGQKKAADELQEYNTSKVTLNILNLSCDIRSTNKKNQNSNRRISSLFYD